MFSTADLWSTCWTNVTLFPSHMKNAKRGGGKCPHTVLNISLLCSTVSVRWLSLAFVSAAQGTTRCQTPPVCSMATSGPCTWNTRTSWRQQMLTFVSPSRLKRRCFYCIRLCLHVELMLSDAITVQLDGTKSKEQLFNFVYGDILNNIQKTL